MDIETDKDILAMVERKHSESIQQQQRGLIIQPGAVGDCILTLPLAQILKQTLNLGGVDLLGHMDYTGYFPNEPLSIVSAPLIPWIFTVSLVTPTPLTWTNTTH